MSATIQPRFGEDSYPIGRYILDRARVLGLSRTDLVQRSGYRDLNSGQRALTELLLTGIVPSFIEKKLAGRQDGMRREPAHAGAIPSVWLPPLRATKNPAHPRRLRALTTLPPGLGSWWRSSVHTAAWPPSRNHNGPGAR